MSAASWLDSDEQRVWRAFLRVNSVMHDELDRDLQRKHGMTLVEYGILVHLSESEGKRERMSGLADTVIVSKSRLSHQVARLERDGLVRRETCEEDRRGSWAVLTESGEAALRAAAPDHVTRVRECLFDQLSAEHIAQLHEILNVLEAGLSRGR
ncbi:MarR family winged helix-turn-helix transcriptional regulator [Halostreptopolyspora alba]|uniref:MarR family transcriptional regulator n=1 Tax=Halostreptopolyspora alba TaxID=2487137 RepID=A0A3N0EEY7_9ACTN|nr:MarR family transcriptional regulator [Nocardiopsaceae bacterium YIM 96095]